jgi:dTMP kinase
MFYYLLITSILEIRVRQFKDMPGVFVVIEGCDGSGKTTAAEYIRHRLAELNIKVMKSREPGGTPMAEEIRKIMLTDYHEGVDVGTNLLLMCASRNQHVKKRIVPALEEGYVFITDRYLDSSIVYQGMVEGLDKEIFAIRNTPAFSYLNDRPDFTIFMDVVEELSDRRQKSRPNINNNKYDDETDTHKHNIFEGYCKLREDLKTLRPVNYYIVDANKSLEEINKHLDEIIIKIIEVLNS